MKKTFDLLRITRENLLKTTQALSLEQLNTIPSGFNNNIVWHIGHLICSQQRLCYQMAGLPFKLPEDSFAKFGKGTRPGGVLPAEEVEFLRSALITSLEEMDGDYQNGLFQNYREYETSFGAVLKSIDDALHFMAVHEGLHLGYVMAMKRLI